MTPRILTLVSRLVFLAVLGLITAGFITPFVLAIRPPATATQSTPAAPAPAVCPSPGEEKGATPP